MKQNHIVVFLFFADETEIIMGIQTESPFRECLQVFIETALGFFDAATSINLLGSNVSQ